MYIINFENINVKAYLPFEFKLEVLEDLSMPLIQVYIIAKNVVSLCTILCLAIVALKFNHTCK